MKILVVNCGSSSLKYQLIDMTNEEVIAKGNYERIADEFMPSFVTHSVKGKEKIKIENPVKNHDEAFKYILDLLLDEEKGVISSLSEISAIGHRIVPGGEDFKESVLVNDDTIRKIEGLKDLAPVHIPGHVEGIKACKKLMPNTPMVCVFDTAFHQTIPEYRYLFPIPYKFYEKYKIRKYGAHGTSYRYVSSRINEILGRDDLKVVICHLGQGASLCAVENGKSVDTTMGLTPLGGIEMCARSGDLDPSVVTYIMEKENLTPKEMETLLNKESGVYGISEVSSDFRDIEKAKEEGNKKAINAINSYCYNVAQYILKMAGSMKGIDCIVFTAGVGEHQVQIRKNILENLEWLGIKVDDEKNKAFGDEAEITTKDSKVKAFVIPTNEELLIARDTMKIISNK